MAQPRTEISYSRTRGNARRAELHRFAEPCRVSGAERIYRYYHVGTQFFCRRHDKLSRFHSRLRRDPRRQHSRIEKAYLPENLFVRRLDMVRGEHAVCRCGTQRICRYTSAPQPADKQAFCPGLCRKAKLPQAIRKCAVKRAESLGIHIFRLGKGKCDILPFFLSYRGGALVACYLYRAFSYRFRYFFLAENNAVRLSLVFPRIFAHCMVAHLCGKICSEIRHKKSLLFLLF